VPVVFSMMHKRKGGIQAAAIGDARV
jgi:hypothetical protein